ncbi:hypothetical protein J4E80_011014 [Alternaria sp. BMP 0032]|nr:hypothetical protein J4E80_011014 [Alternaria sp. BMP 0032]
MAWVPSNAPQNILAAVSAPTWNAWADGSSLNVPPHRQTLTYAFRLNTSFDSPHPENIKYKKGMQGQFLGLHATNKTLARIFIQGVTEGDTSRHRFVPVKFLDKGKPWQTDLDKWELDVQVTGPTEFDKRDWSTASLPDTTVLGKTITRLISAFRHSPPSFAPEKISAYIEKANITALTLTIIDGIKQAGLYDVLTSKAPFNAKQLIAPAKHKIVDLDSSNSSGVYARVHWTKEKDVSRWEGSSTYLYVGKTNDFASRNEQHKHGQSSYGDLTRNSEVTKMIALCVLPNTADHGLYYLTEQIFVCLLDTYRPDVVDPSHTSPEMLPFFQPAKYFVDISREVSKMTGWPGLIRRGPISSGVRYGANCSSPLMEYAFSTEQFLFIRTDVDIKCGNTGSVVPMAFYRRSDKAVVSSARRKIFVKSIIKGGRKKSVIQFVWKSLPKKNMKPAVEKPPPGSPFEMVIEVRKDGTPHPHAWARLPKIGRFKNWDQANSFAVRVEWESPRGSGKWNFQYLQATQLYRRLDNKVPGSFATYAKSVSFLQWLTNSKPNHNHTWIPRLQGAARVLQSELDFMNQAIKFREPKKDILMLSGEKRSDNDIKAVMNRQEYGLDRVDGDFGDFGSSTERSRQHCDTCAMAAQNLRAMFPDATCVPTKHNSRLCTNCEAFGRPCCSWTSGIPVKAVRNYPNVSIEAALVIGKYQSILTALPPVPIPQEQQSFEQQLRSLQDKDEMDYDNDGSDAEDDDSDDGEDNSGDDDGTDLL